MQGLLIGLASAITLAIAGAFAAPYVVDWNNWRGTFEREISDMLGVPVVIRGAIQAELLPAPRMVLHDVTLGDVISTGGTMQQLDAEFSLGSLMRGELQATGITLVRPHMRLVLDSAGRIARPTGIGMTSNMGIAHFTVEHGTLDVLDRGSEHTFTFSSLNLEGEARSLAGPFKLDGTLTAAGLPFTLRASLGELDAASSGRLRLALNGQGQPYSITVDGRLGMAQAAPHFAGQAMLAHLPTAQQAASSRLASWRLSGTVEASPTEVRAQELSLGFGTLASVPQFTGTGQMMLGRRIGVNATLHASTLDLDALMGATGDKNTTAPGLRLAGMAQTLVPFLASLPAPDAPSRIGISVDQLALGGTLVREVKSELSGIHSGWRINHLTAQMPGDASISLSGASVAGQGGGDGFDGWLILAADDLPTFLHWAAPDAPRLWFQALNSPAWLETSLTISPEQIEARHLDARFGAAELAGNIITRLSGARPHLSLTLNMEGFALEGLLPGLGQAAQAADGLEARLNLTGKDLTLMQTPVSGLALEATTGDGGWKVQRLALDNPEGLHLEGEGWLQHAATQPEGRFSLALTGERAEGLAPVARLLAGEDTANVLNAISTIAAPVDLKAELEWKGAEGRKAQFTGTLGELSGTTIFTRPQNAAAQNVELMGDVAEAGRLFEILGLTDFAPRPGPAHLEMKLEHAPTTPAKTTPEAMLAGRLTLSGLEMWGEGPVHIRDGQLQPRLAMRLEGADLGRLLPRLSEVTGAPAPVGLSFTLTDLSPTWQLEALDGMLAGLPLAGTLNITPGDTPRLGGVLNFDSLDLPRLLALFAARAPEGSTPWSSTRFAPPMARNVALDLKLAARTLSIPGPYKMTDGQLRLLSNGKNLEMRDLFGSFGGGRVSANLNIRPTGETLRAEGRLMLDAVSSTALLAPVEARHAPQGQVSLSLDLSGSGRSLQALVKDLSGQGTIAVQRFSLPQATPDALAAVLQNTAHLTPPPDERRTAQLLNEAFARGPLNIAAIGSTLGVSQGMVRLSPTHTTLGNVRITFAGELDLARLRMETELDFEATAGTLGLAGGQLMWRGPVDDPERHISATALTSALAMRAIELETQRLEAERRAQEEQRRAQEAERKQATEQVQPAPAIPSPAPSAPIAIPAAPATPRLPSSREPQAPASSTGQRNLIERQELPPPVSDRTGIGTASPAPQTTRPVLPPSEQGAQATPRNTQPARSRPARRPAEPRPPRDLLPPVHGFGNVPRPPAPVGSIY
ncbi:AsmA family protein [Xanthobacter sp. TB0139]|uniref:AsmA family protein n=1 Tax=Xanthobacter sp. TB0139 TaxID=3459178 RepID=UPI00403A174F